MDRETQLLDPTTGLPSGAVWTRGIDGEDCLRAWEYELLGEDALAFRELAAAEVPAGGLSLATRGCPARSSRHRELLEPRGFADELRAVLRADGSTWGVLTVLREHGRPSFGPADVAAVADLSNPLAEALGAQAERPAPAAGGRVPEVMVFAPTGALIARTHGAAALVDQLPREPRVDVGAGVHLPLAPATLLVAARAVAERRMSGPAQARLQLPGGGWLAAQASCMIEASGAIAATALVIKATGAGDIAAIALRAHRLTAREAEIARMVAQGLGTIAMVHQLHLSVHTLRDYIKAIFAKTGVSTRGELVAKLLGTAALADPGRPLGDGDDGPVIG